MDSVITSSLLCDSVLTTPAIGVACACAIIDDVLEAMREDYPEVDTHQVLHGLAAAIIMKPHDSERPTYKRQGRKLDGWGLLFELCTPDHSILSTITCEYE